MKMSTLKVPVNKTTGNDKFLSILYEAFTTATYLENRTHEILIEQTLNFDMTGSKKVYDIVIWKYSEG